MRFVSPETASPASRWTSRIALFSFGILVTAAFLHRLFGMPTPIAFNLVAAAYAGACLSILTGLVATVGIWRSGSMGTARVVFGVLLSLGMLTGPLLLFLLTKEFPPINDLTTDARSPPEFATLAKARSGPNANPAAYPGERFAAEQARAYPDIKPMRLNRSSEEAFELVVDALHRLKMDIVREEPPAADGSEPGMIEAVDRTLVVGFYDDVSIRVTGDDTSARVDLRSASRYGWTDLGRNAERLRTLMREIQTRVDATVPTADGERAPRPKGASRAAPKQEKDADPKSVPRRRSRDRVQ